MPTSAWVRDVTEENFEADVLMASEQRPVVVDFWASWCQPCLRLGPVLERLTDAHQGRILLAKVDTEDAPGLAQYFRISSIPAVKVFFRGELVHEFVGVQPDAALEQFFDELAQLGGLAAEEAPPVVDDDPVRAEATYRQAVDKQPDDVAARVGLARALLRLGRAEEVAAVLEPVGSAGETGAEADALLARARLALAAKELPDVDTLRRNVTARPQDAAALLDLGIRLAAQEQYPEALQAVFAAAERDVQLAAGRAREVMVQVFYALGPSHPLSNEYRGKLSRLLY